MKKILVKFIVFLIGLIVLDLMVGIVSKPLLLNEPDAGNNHSNLKQSLYNKKADILILGASKANHHYVNDSFSKHFELSVFNCGIDGENIITSRVQLQAMADRHLPKMIIMDLSGGQLAGNWESVFLKHKAYAGIEDHYTFVVESFVSRKNRMCLLSNLYKLNEELPDISLSYLKGNHCNNGYIPLIGSNDHISHIVKDMDYYFLGQTQRENLDFIIDYCTAHEIKLYAVYSPSLITYTNGLSTIIEAYCISKGVPFFNYESDSIFISHPEYFKDFNHLNNIGAELFTSDIIIRIQNNQCKYE